MRFDTQDGAEEILPTRQNKPGELTYPTGTERNAMQIKFHDFAEALMILFDASVIFRLFIFAYCLGFILYPLRWLIIVSTSRHTSLLTRCDFRHSIDI
jgi:hypothetical protein